MSVTGSLLFPAALVAAFFLLAAARQLVLRTQRPGWVLQRLQRHDDPGERGVGATATEELHALLYAGKRVQLEQRRIELVLRDDENDGAPPRTGIDLDAGTARILRAPGGSPSTPNRVQPPQEDQALSGT
ncbi:DUF6191 domain-containing protein [Kitasatospora sp. NPDC056446]|uniref:DUF6191 domain-containing protein n=1 Tax=Kitasatospora sp. NPDC056446 TaxID=3345819 RepID=UPI0036CBC4D2